MRRNVPKDQANRLKTLQKEPDLRYNSRALRIPMYLSFSTPWYFCAVKGDLAQPQNVPQARECGEPASVPPLGNECRFFLLPRVFHVSIFTIR